MPPVHTPFMHTSSKPHAGLSQGKPFGACVSGGQRAVLPVQYSATPQVPPDARHKVLDG